MLQARQGLIVYLINCSQAEALGCVEAIAGHVPRDEPAGSPNLIHGGRVVITDDDHRFALEVDAETGDAFVTRTRVVGPGQVELVAWQDGREIVRRVETIQDPA